MLQKNEVIKELIKFNKWWVLNKQEISSFTENIEDDKRLIWLGWILNANNEKSKNEL